MNRSSRAARAGLVACEPLDRRVMLAAAAATPPAILFVRGATRSGGFLEATTAAGRNAQLADINDGSAAAGNSGWGTLAAALRDQGFSVEQINEAKEPGAPASGFVQGRAIR